MNSTEILLLALSLYGHDWGMAVSENEMDCITQNESQCNDFALLHNENTFFEKYLKEIGVLKGDKITQTMWQEYIRKTHAYRSAERIMRYFESIDTGVGEAVARICEGHWVDIKDLMDYSQYPTNFSVLGETVNLKSLTIYLRLIDLFDIGNDRTPYVIWKYVSPRNTTSKMEWSKHRALQPITCPTYQDGRVIVVDGSTDDYNVYASLIDLKNYCSEQLKACTDILAQINDPYHKLDIYHIEWRVKPRHFKPLDIQFEFDRLKMFDILSDDIYKGSIYIFLRELLQNSIDAIKARKEILSKKGLYSDRIGKINVDIKHKENGDSVIVFSDDGIGMDEYIVKNYLGVAGRSYYMSSDFEKLGLKMDPISRFGVGILSCFMVANEIQIETLREPYISNSKERLRINIPSVDKQFRIELQNSDTTSVGTKITIPVLAQKIREKIREDIEYYSLKVTEYLKRIAGFVEYPIIINEEGKKTIIIHPYKLISDYDYLLESPDLFYQLDLSFPYEEAILLHSISNAKEHFQELKIDVKKDLKVENLEGSLIFLQPKKNSAFIKRVINLQHFTEFIIYDSNLKKISSIKASEKWEANLLVFQGTNDFHELINERIFPQLKIFADGILVEEALVGLNKTKSYLLNFFYFFYRRSISHYLVINITKKEFGKLDLSRTRIVSKEKNLIKTLEGAFENFIKIKYLKNILDKEPLTRLLELAHLSVCFNIPSETILGLLPNDKFLIGVIKDEEGVEIIEVENKSDLQFNSLPYEYETFFKNSLTRLIKHTKSKRTKHWIGDKMIISRDVYEDHDTLNFNSINDILTKTITDNYFISNVKFITAPIKTSPPLAQFRYKRKSNLFKKKRDQLINSTAITFDTFNTEEASIIVEFINEKRDESDRLITGPFSEPFHEKVGYNFTLLNTLNPIALNLIVSIFMYLKKVDEIVERNIETSLLKEKFSLIPFLLYDGNFEGNFDDLNNLLKEFGELLEKTTLCKNYFKQINLSEKDFVPGAIEVGGDALGNYFKEVEVSNNGLRRINKFGNPYVPL